ncbi:MAG: 6-phosphogluconolactonase [Deltaproteobacteria bacterium]|nr:6-phosphogluconolactonase [Deltaproteobacteria bacterium]
MPLKVIIARDFEHLSDIAAQIIKQTIIQTFEAKEEFVLGLATGNSPTRVYKHLARAANDGEFDSSRIRSFNLDEYVGLPGDNVQQRVLHPESYCYFMIQEFFGLLQRKFIETCVPYGCMIDQQVLAKELHAYPDDWHAVGTDAGKSILIHDNPTSHYLGWVREEILEGYERKIEAAGGVDLQIIGVGGRGHVAFHESGIPFAGSRVMLVKLDENTIANAVMDGHFSCEAESPHYAVSMGAELVYRARTLVLLANGERKVRPVTESLVDDPTPEIPISYGQLYARGPGNLVYVVDTIAGRELLAAASRLEQKGITIENLS